MSAEDKLRNHVGRKLTSTVIVYTTLRIDVTPQIGEAIVEVTTKDDVDVEANLEGLPGLIP